MFLDLDQTLGAWSELVFLALQSSELRLLATYEDAHVSKVCLSIRLCWTKYLVLKED